MTDRRRLLLIALSFVAFISLGLPDGLLGVAWPSMRYEFGRPLDALGPLLISNMIGYMLSSFFSGILSRRLGIGRLLAFSCAATGAALLGFTVAPSWWLVVAIGIVVGLGAGAIDAGLNTYVAKHHSERLMQWLHASFGVGITLGPLIMTAGLNLAETWRAGYWVVGGAQVTLGVCFLLTANRWESGTVAEATEQSALEDAGAEEAVSPAESYQVREASFWESLGDLSVWISMGLFFTYTGLEMTLGHWAYSLLTESRGVAGASAGLWVGVYWGMFTVGRMVAGVFAGLLGNHRLVLGSLGLALTGSLLFAWNPVGWLGLVAVGLIGFAFAPIFPGMVSGTHRRVGTKHLSNTMGMQIAAAGLGAACLPSLVGVLANRFSLEVVPVFLVVFVVVLGGLYFASRRRAGA
ncbi:MFS transporter [Pelagicoccus sp. SDUM812002]|uniref:MFS transporter n=1 Tax=Pelagicoccus sp. SDUM812002 TaxID=3041266 RepID=UPI00280D7D77|nr:MFS transporter [Pelagicoccus sp. SDUM812002]MDQ8185154.1 MFS transporter [Pelagicoccus sp. SDUM812002]